MGFCSLRLMRIRIREIILIKNVMLLNLMEHWMVVENVLFLKNSLTLKIEINALTPQKVECTNTKINSSSKNSFGWEPADRKVLSHEQILFKLMSELL